MTPFVNLRSCSATVEKNCRAGVVTAMSTSSVKRVPPNCRENGFTDGNEAVEDSSGNNENCDAICL